MSEEIQKPSSSESSKTDYAIGGVVGGIVIAIIGFFCLAMMIDAHENSKECKDIRRELEATDRTADLRYADQKRDSVSLQNLHLRIRDIEDFLDKQEEAK